MCNSNKHWAVFIEQKNRFRISNAIPMILMKVRKLLKLPQSPLWLSQIMHIHVIFEEHLNPFLNMLRVAVAMILFVFSMQAKETTLTAEIQAPIIADGKQIGIMKLPVGSAVTIISVESDGVLVRRGEGSPFKVAKEFIPPEAIAVPAVTPTATPVPVVLQATPAPKITPQVTPTSGPPSLPLGFVGHPEFDTHEGRQSAGTAFLSKTPGNDTSYLLTVRHLLGPMGGFKQLTPPEKVPSFVRSITLRPLTSGSSINYLVHGLLVPATSDQKSPLFDLAIFKTPSANRNSVLELASQKTALGEKVWLFADIEGGVSRNIYSHPITITYNGDRWLVGNFDESNIVTRGASGAPVLNSSGKVVGIYSAHGKDNGKTSAFIIPRALF